MNRASARVTVSDPAIAAIMTGRSRQAAAISWLREAALLPAIVVLIIVGTFVNSAFFAVSNFTGIGQQIAARCSLQLS